MQTFPVNVGWAWLGLVGFVFAGCDSAPPKPAEHAEHGHEHGDHSHDNHAHDHGHDHSEESLPKSYAEGVQQLADLQVKIRAAFAKDDTKTADGPVHEFGHVLESIGPLAEKAGLSTEDQAEIKTAVEQLFDDFEKVDAKIHGGEGVSYSEVEAQVDAALATLKKYVPDQM